MSNHKDVTDDDEFTALLASSGSKLVVVDYNATWCGPCKAIHPVFLQLAHKFPEALFLGVDVDQCRDTAMSQGVSAMPTFIFYRNQKKLDSVRGANAAELEEKIRKHYGSPESMDPNSSGVGGISDVFSYIDMKGCECLNESDATPFRSFIEKKSKLVSDCDEQLIINLPFNQQVKVHSVYMKGPAEHAPRIVKVFANIPNSLDFDKAQSTEPIQTLDFSESEIVQLRFVKFQNVTCLQILIDDNFGGDVTKIGYVEINGTAGEAVDMKNWSGDSTPSE